VVVSVFVQEGQAYADENGLFFIETSAKSAQNVNEVFYEIGKLQRPSSILFGIGLRSQLKGQRLGLFCFLFRRSRIERLFHGNQR
jgi:hypothetical protein